MLEAEPVRVATIADLDAIIAADDIASGGDQDRLSVLVGGVESGCCLVYTDQTRVDGFVICKPKHFFGRDFVDLLVVAPRARRSGIGRTLLRAAVTAAGTDQVFTSTNQSNDPMRALLSGEGWLFSGRLDGLDSDDPELIFFIERLSATPPTRGVRSRERPLDPQS